ncbi:MAG: hypothetical protein ABR521_13480 [Gaiellaceae bacterium]
MTANLRITVAVGIAAAALSAAGVAGSQSRFAGVTGLQGTVTMAPTTPVCRVGVPCEGPAAGVTLVFSRAGKAPVTTRTDAQGRYKVALDAAIYTVATGSRRLGGSPYPARVKVRFAHLDRLDFRVDTGIR